MNNKKKILYSITANVMSTCVSATIALILPKVLTVESYSSFQYYLFWSGYLGFLHLGWIDGIYLVHCGEYYDRLDKEKLKGQLRLFAAFQLVLSVALIILFISGISEIEYRDIFVSVSILLPITNLRLFFLYILQASARIREYSDATILGLVCYMLGIVICIIIGRRDYDSYIYVNIISNVVTLGSSLLFCRDIVTSKARKVMLSAIDAAEYIKVGHKILIANFASSWIVGIVRVMVERRWDLATFGRVSLTLTISNMFMTLINAVALVILPVLRRLDSSKLKELYSELNILVTVSIFGLMCLYYPVQRILSIWLPEYASSLAYLGMLFPICLFEGKNALLLNTYMKAMRQENAIMWVNSLCVIFSALLSYMSINVYSDMTLTMFCIVVSIAVRCFAFELLIQNGTGINVYGDIAIEISVASIFILANWCIGGLFGLALYLTAFCLLCLIKREEIENSIRSLILN